MNFNDPKAMAALVKKMSNKAPAGNPQQSSNKAGKNVDAETNDMKKFGGSFHNPYTFIPFPAKSPVRNAPSLLTADESDNAGKRFTGVLQLKVQTVSPLLTMDSENREEEGKHFKYKALTIGKDVVVPATSIRGSLRSLMTVLSGGTLAYMDANMWLCQNRDLSMNLSGKNGAKKTKLAEVCSAGDFCRDGTIFNGITRVISIGELNELLSRFGETLARSRNFVEKSKAKELDSWRPVKDAEPCYLYTNDEKTELSLEYSASTPWKIKLSGRRISHKLDENFPEIEESLLKQLARQQNVYLDSRSKIWVDSPFEPTSIKVGKADRKHPRYFCEYNRNNHNYSWYTYGTEAMFLKEEPANTEVLESRMWADYAGQNAHGVRPNLKEGDLVWLELDESDSIKSIQWARWGRGGAKSVRFQDALAQSSNGERNFLIPDSMNSDGKVDMVTDMFGMVADNKSVNVNSFAARVRCHNLVFVNASQSGLERNVQLAPLAQPHAGCMAFYRSADGKKLNGYKVYRNAVSGETPWLYSEQGMFDKQGIAMTAFLRQAGAKTVELLKENQVGSLKISFRALSESELALLVKTCEADWKLGGGKSLGLGHCKVTELAAIDENGETIDLSNLPSLETLKERFEWYAKSQTPVENMRYPRAVGVSNNNSVQRNGLEWFKRHANVNTKGFEQNLPSIKSADQHLYCYDFQNGRKRKDPPEPFNSGESRFSDH